MGFTDHDFRSSMRDAANKAKRGSGTRNRDWSPIFVPQRGERHLVRFAKYTTTSPPLLFRHFNVNGREKGQQMYVICACEEGCVQERKDCTHCAACAAWQADPDGPVRGPTLTIAMTVNDLGRYHSHEETVRRGDRKGEKYTLLEKCRASGGRKDCKACDDGLKKVYGGKRVWFMTSGLLDDVNLFIDELATSCRGCERETYPDKLYCRSCREVLYDVDDLAAKSPAESDELRGTPQECSACGETATLGTKYGCEGGCSKTLPGKIYLTNVVVTKTAVSDDEGGERKGTQKTRLDRQGDWGKIEEKYEGLDSAPLDPDADPLVRWIKPLPIPKQAKALGLKKVPEGVEYARGATDYEEKYAGGQSSARRRVNVGSDDD